MDPQATQLEPSSPEDMRARLRARRFLYLGAFSFTAMPADVILHTVLTGYEPRMPGIAIASLLPILMLLWAARLVTRQDFVAQALVRSIAVSNLIVALLLAVSVGGVIGAFGQVLLAGSCYAVLRLLDGRGLERSEEGSSFTPVAFRGFLVLAIVMAFADAQTLMFSAFAELGDLYSGEALGTVLVDMGPTLIAALIMALNVWGLLRLRAWAMLLNIVANLAIARMALDGVLNVNHAVAAALFSTAVVQLMLPVPILAAMLGDRDAGGPGWGRGARLLRACVPVVALATMGMAVQHCGFSHLWGWDVDGVKTVEQRGLPNVDPILYEARVRQRGLRMDAAAYGAGH